MKRNILIIAILLSSLFMAHGQEKGFHLALSGNYGYNTFHYMLENKRHALGSDNHSQFPNG